MGSSRLPGKSLLKLAGKPLISHIIERLKNCKMYDNIVLATTCNDEDNVLENIAFERKINVFRGSENDLVDRIYSTAKKNNADIVVRFPADNATPEPKEVDKIIKFYINNDYDFCSNLCNIYDNGYPDGIGAEVFSFKVLSKIYNLKASARNREHLSLYFYDYYEKKSVSEFNFSTGTISCPKSVARPNLKLSIDTFDDYIFISKIYDYFYELKPLFSIKDVVEWYDNIYNR